MAERAGDDLRAVHIASVQALAASDPAHTVRTTSDGAAVRAGSDLDVYVAARAVRLGTAGVDARFVVDEFGCDGAHGPLSAGEPRPDPAAPNRIAIARNARGKDGRDVAVEEWYVAGPLGLEQGFDIDAPSCGEELRVGLSVAGATLESDRDEVRIVGDGAALRYGELAAFDARGRPLPSRLQVEDDRILLDVDVRGATHPIVIDPLVYTEGFARYGFETPFTQDTFPTANGTIDIDGDRAVACSSATGAPAIYYEFVGGVWRFRSLIVPELAPAGFGNCSSVQLDGDRLAVGAVTYSGAAGTSQGAAYVFRFEHGRWIEEQRLLASDAAMNDQFGRAVALVGDELFVSAPNNTISSGIVGALYAFHRTDSIWVETQRILPTTNNLTSFGVSIAQAGNWLIVGAGNQSKAFAYARSGGSWSFAQELPSISASSGFGASVGIVGETVAVGAPYISGSTGSVRIMTYSGGFWTTAIDFSPAAGTNGFCGMDLELLEDEVVIGCPTSSSAGQVFSYRRVSGTWTTSGSVSVFAPTVANDYGPGYAVAATSTRLIAGTVTSTGSTPPPPRLFTAARATAADAWTRSSDITNGSYNVAGASFGYSVAIDGDTMVVGAPVSGTLSADFRGRVYVFRRLEEHWLLEAELATDDMPTGYKLGSSVAIDGDTLVAGAGRPSAVTDSTLPGAAFVFVRSGTAWSLQQKLVGTSPANGDLGGASVAIDGDTIALSAHRGGASQRGKVTIFTRSGTTWSIESSIEPFDGVGGYADFGCSVDLDGNRLLVGSKTDSGNGNYGSAYFYLRTGTTWNFEAKVVPDDRDVSPQFGHDVSLDGDRAAISSRNATVGSYSNTGAVYVFERSGATWTQRAKLTVPDAANNDYLGTVALEGDRLLAGADGRDLGSDVDVGRVHLFERGATGWTLESTFSDTRPTASAFFGSALAIQGTTVVIGAHGSKVATYASYARANLGRIVTGSIPYRRGQVCTADAECETGVCADGVCCDVACNDEVGTCRACSVAAGAQVDGTCHVVSTGDACMPDLDGGVGDGRPSGVVRRPKAGLCAASMGARSPGALSLLGCILVLGAIAIRRRGGRAALFLFLGLALVASSATAHAQDGQSRESVARAQFRLGQAYFEERRFEEAGRAFEAAYAASGRPALLQNAYIAYRDGQLPAQAEGALRRYLEVLPSAATPELRAALASLESQRLERERAAAEAAAAAAAATPPVVTPPPVEATPVDEAPAASAEPRRRSLVLPVALMAGGGALAIGGFLGGGLALRHHESRLDGHCGAAVGLPSGECVDDAVVRDVGSKTTGLRVLAYGSLAVGVGVAGSGVVLLLLGRGDRDEAPTALVVPTVDCSPDGCRVGAVGRF